MRYPVRRCCLFAAMVFSLSSGFAGAIGTTPPFWKPRETVTSTLASPLYMEGADRSMAYDHHGSPGIVFCDPVSGDLRYARRAPGIGWVHAAIDTSGFVGLHPSLAYDRYERPAVSYYDITNTTLKFARLNGSVWQKESLPAANGGVYTSLAFDLLGRPAIAYQDFDDALRYLYDTDGDFSLVDEQPVLVASQFSEGNYATLAFDPWNRPMIAHMAANGGSALLRFSLLEPGIGWLTSTVDDIGPLNNTSTHSLAIDPDTGFPAIAYMDRTSFDLRYAAWDGHSWNLATVDSAGAVGVAPSIAFDPADGNPAIAYSDYGAGDYLNLKVAWHDGSNWQTQTVDDAGNAGANPSLAFNDYGSGFPSIAYFDDNTALYFIDDPPRPAVPEPGSAMLLAVGMAIGFGCRKTLLGR